MVDNIEQARRPPAARWAHAPVSVPRGETCSAGAACAAAALPARRAGRCLDGRRGVHGEVVRGRHVDTLRGGGARQRTGRAADGVEVEWCGARRRLLGVVVGVLQHE